MGMAQGGPPAIAYAARHPERVTRLLFYGSYAGRGRGLDREPGGARGVRAADQGRVGPAGAHLPAGLHLDDDPGRHRGADALARRAAAGRRLRRDRLRRAAPAVAGRLHRPAARARRADPGAALGRRPDERLRARPAPRHAASPAPGWCRWTATTTSCSGTSRPGRSSSRRSRPSWRPDGSPGTPGPPDGCCRRVSARCSRWSPTGRDNDEIAAELVLSVRTVERHLQNVYAQARPARTVGASGRGRRAWHVRSRAPPARPTGRRRTATYVPRRCGPAEDGWFHRATAGAPSGRSRP